MFLEDCFSPFFKIYAFSKAIFPEKKPFFRTFLRDPTVSFEFYGKFAATLWKNFKVEQIKFSQIRHSISSDF